MNFLDLARARRSVRRYTDRPVSREIIERCLEAARIAPSACNSQPWKFVVVDDPALRNRLADEAFSGIYSMNRFAARAPVLVAVITDRSKYAARLGGQFRGMQYNLVDIGIACEHLVLQAAEDGVGTCWLGWFNEKSVRRVLGLSSRERIDILISMGYPEVGEVRDGSRKSLDAIRRYASPGDGS